MWPIDKIIHVLTYRNRPDLAHALRGAQYDLNESTTYGSRLYSTLTTAEIYAPIQKHDLLQKLTDDDRKEIIKAFHVLHPVRERDIEINWIEFLVDPESPIPQATRPVSRLCEVDFLYINEQIQKCDEKIGLGDFEGAITNARNLLESISKYLLDEANVSYDESADLPELYKQASHILNMHPSQHVEKSFKQILSGCFSVIQGLASVRNELSDAHGKSKNRHYKASERHAMFSVGVAKSLADFMYASYKDNMSKNSQ